MDNELYLLECGVEATFSLPAVRGSILMHFCGLGVFAFKSALIGIAAMGLAAGTSEKVCIDTVGVCPRYDGVLPTD